MTGPERRARLKRAQLYVCTPVRDDLEWFLDQVLEAGVNIVQLRDKNAPEEAQRRAARVFRDVCDRHGALFIMNDSIELARDSGADGLHLGQEDDAPEKARALLGDEMVIGRSTHAPNELRRALTEPVDYLGVGPVHPTPTKPGRPGVGLASVRSAATSLPATSSTLPWFVTGGMDAQTIPEAIGAGARRFVVVRAINDAHDPAAEVKRLRALLPPLV